MDFKNYLKRAQKEGWAMGHFNISNIETLWAIVRAAQNLKSPVIIGTSEGESRFLGLRQAAALVRSMREEFKFPIFLNLDHGKSFDYIKEAINMGYDSVHFDGSKLPLEENIKITKEVVRLARGEKISVEGEVGFISGFSQVLERVPEIKKEDLTDPKDALRFISETKVDRLAVNVGTFHGIEVSGVNPHINLSRLREIRNEVGDKVFLVLHGGSGTPKEDIKEAIKLGVVNIHFNTELRLAFTNTLKKALAEDPKETTPYKYMPKVILAIQEIVEDKIRLFNSVKKL